MFTKACEHFADVFGVFFGILGEYENVVQIHHYEFVKDIGEDRVHKMLESGGSVSETEVHDHKIKGTVSSAEGGFPLVAGSNANEVVSATKVDFGEDLR